MKLVNGSRSAEPKEEKTTGEQYPKHVEGINKDILFSVGLKMCFSHIDTKSKSDPEVVTSSASRAQSRTNFPGDLLSPSEDVRVGYII